MISSTQRRLVSKGLVLVAGAMASAACLGALPHEAGAQSAFYLASRAELAGRPGTLIRTEPMLGAPDGAAAYRVLYRSRGLHDEPIAVSGVVIIPAGPAPPDGRPIVAWAHPTTGVVPRCAPSLALFMFQQVQGLRAMVERGYVVTATDYPGLGTAGPHPYLVGISEGRAVLDSVRAARIIGGADSSRRFAVWGHSQGGQASLYTGILAKTYAPELDLVGVAAAAPATELAKLMTEDLNSNGGRNLTAMTLWSWARVFGAPIERAVEPAAIPVVNRLAGECIESIYDMIVRQRTARPLAADVSVDRKPRRRRAMALAGRQQYARAAPCRRADFPLARNRRQSGPARGDQGLCEHIVQGRQPRADALDARRQSRVHRPRQRRRCGRMDVKPVCRAESAERLRLSFAPASVDFPQGLPT